ncbi:PD-(D/E)XK nuclease family protein [Aggregatilinea lenta]|uniref:PD-(D/E)XK nuclease family protein n=1 Tax=Aggregatilinea lenta TaxID=913108 RepID=UPI000E5BBD15|nr:PD-(D/E)XK nuclease family protein [Aggregatilinea lenta]
MNTLCLDSGQTLDWSDCLSCAATGTQPCGWDYALLRATRDHQARVRTGIHVSDVKDCPRRAILEKTLPEPAIYPSESEIVLIGTAVHALTEHNDHEVWTDVPVIGTFGGHVLIGTADAYYFKLGRLVDYKTTRRISKDKLPYGAHEDQVRIYAMMMRQMGLAVNSAAIQYIDMMGPARCPYCKTGKLIPGQVIYTCQNCGREWDAGKSSIHSGAVSYEVDLDGLDVLSVEVTDRLEHLNEALASGRVPAGDPSWLCQYCQFHGDCPDALT